MDLKIYFNLTSLNIDIYIHTIKNLNNLHTKFEKNIKLKLLEKNLWIKKNTLKESKRYPTCVYIYVCVYSFIIGLILLSRGNPFRQSLSGEL